jgi:hypothetical protein
MNYLKRYNIFLNESSEEKQKDINEWISCCLFIISFVDWLKKEKKDWKIKTYYDSDLRQRLLSLYDIESKNFTVDSNVQDMFDNSSQQIELITCPFNLNLWPYHIKLSTMESSNRFSKVGIIDNPYRLGIYERNHSKKLVEDKRRTLTMLCDYYTDSFYLMGVYQKIKGDFNAQLPLLFDDSEFKSIFTTIERYYVDKLKEYQIYLYDTNPKQDIIAPIVPSSYMNFRQELGEWVDKLLVDNEEFYMNVSKSVDFKTQHYTEMRKLSPKTFDALKSERGEKGWKTDAAAEMGDLGFDD